MTTRITRRLSELRARGEKGLVVYLTAGDPNLDETAELVLAAARGGADVVELGVPWSDPSADGPVIQRAMERALAGGATLARVLDVVRVVRAAGVPESEVPIVLFGYYNPIVARGPERVVAEAAAAGIDGFLVVDLALEEAEELDASLRAAHLDRIPLLAPTTSPERAARHAARGSGFAYYVSLAGVTGAGHLDSTAVADKLAALRPSLAVLPIAVGFGVKTPADARALAPAADAVVVGSAFVQAIAAAPDPQSRRQSVYEMARAFKDALVS